LRGRLVDLNVPFDSFVDYLDELDPATAAALVEELVRADDVELLKLVEGLGLADEAIDGLRDELLGLHEDAEKPIPIDIDDLPARSGFEALVDDFDNTTTDTGLGLDPQEAIDEALSLMGD